MIKIICVGKIKENYLKELIDDYLNRINKYHKIEIIELKEEVNLQKEAIKMNEYINDKDYVILCDIKGDEITSLTLAKLIDDAFVYNSNIDFIIGSSEGIDKKTLKKIDKEISFSKCTFPHGLFRGILLEQIYRAFKINNNESYHK